MATDTGEAIEPDSARIAALDSLRGGCLHCQNCRLGATRTNVVYGVGSPDTPVVFVGEAPGANEDQLGLPFVGRSGVLLDRLISEELGLTRDQIYIANIVKCRPPQNRNPLPDEVEACVPNLRDQLEVILPTLIVALGAVATKFLVSPGLTITNARGKFFATEFGTVMPMFHPAFGLRKGATAVTAMRADLAKVKLHLVEKGAWKLQWC